MPRLLLRGLLVTLIVSHSLRGSQGQTFVGPGEQLLIESPTTEDFVLDGGLLRPRDVTLSGQIDLQSFSQIVRPSNPRSSGGRGGAQLPQGPTNLDGPIVGIGGLEFGNESNDDFFINRNNTYAGETFVTSGEIFATSPTAFGSTSEGTTVQGGILTVQTETDERFRVEGGTLLFEAGDFVTNVPLTIAGGTAILPQRELLTLPVVVDAPAGEPAGSLRFSFSDTGSWTGGSTGTGDLTISGRINIDAPLAHDGDLILEGPALNAVNTYTGRTIFASNYTIDRGDVFGTSTTPLEIDGAVVTVQVLPDGNRGFTIRRGTLDVQTPDPISAGVILGGDFSANIRGGGVFNGPVDYITSPGGGNAALRGGIFNGPIRGTTDLVLGENNGVVELNAANDIAGRARTNGGTVVVNHAEAITLPATQVQTGTLELNVPAQLQPFLTGTTSSSPDGTLQLNVDQDIDETWTVYGGTLSPNADLGFQRVRLVGFNNPARLESTGRRQYPN